MNDDIEFKNFLIQQDTKIKYSIFISNLSPFFKKRNEKLSLTDFIEKIYDKDNLTFENDCKDRSLKLRAKWFESKPKYTFVLIGSNEDSYKGFINDIFNIDYSKIKKKTKELEGFFITPFPNSPDKKVFFLYHPSGSKWSHSLDYVRKHL